MGLADANASERGIAGIAAIVIGATAAPVVWRRSTRCSQDSCVEVADLPDGGVAVRDSKQSFGGPVLTFSAQEWQAFVAGVRAGEFG